MKLNYISTTKLMSVTLLSFLWLGQQPSAQAQLIYDPKPAVPGGCQVVEGDVLVPLAPSSGKFSPEATFGGYQSGTRWPDGVVPYEFDDNVAPANRIAMRKAMDVWEAVANVHFRPKDLDLFWIHIQSSTANNSPVGRWGVANNTVNIYNWDSTYIMAHELGHTLGFWHEQSRSDRDSYIQINSANIKSGFADQFEKHDEANHYGPYDFDSVMHYSSTAFSANGMPTITVLPPNDVDWQDGIGQRNHLSQMDALTMSFLYRQPNWWFVNASYGGWTQDGSFDSPYRSFYDAVNEVPTGGTVWVQPGTYTAHGTYNRAMTWKAPLGGVTLH